MSCSKRAFDVAAASIALLALAPVFALLAVLIKLDGGPVFFRQKRVGLDGREFWFYKFRSMVVHAEILRFAYESRNQHGKDGVTFKIKHDPRITRIGRFLRRASLDELPQLWNVLKGDMSVVGPRPALPAEVACYSETDRLRLAVVPGLTCLWQIQGRAEIPFNQQVELDMEYIARQSFWYDLSLIFRTFPAIVSGKGAY